MKKGRFLALNAVWLSLFIVIFLKIFFNKLDGIIIGGWMIGVIAGTITGFAIRMELEK